MFPALPSVLLGAAPEYRNGFATVRNLRDNRAKNKRKTG
jgi:hypothetical protein